MLRLAEWSCSSAACICHRVDYVRMSILIMRLLLTQLAHVFMIGSCTRRYGEIMDTILERRSGKQGMCRVSYNMYLPRAVGAVVCVHAWS